MIHSHVTAEAIGKGSLPSNRQGLIIVANLACEGPAMTRHWSDGSDAADASHDRAVAEPS